MAYGEPTFRKARVLWTGEMGGWYSTKKEAIRAAKEYGRTRKRALVRIWNKKIGFVAVMT